MSEDQRKGNREMQQSFEFLIIFSSFFATCFPKWELADSLQVNFIQLCIATAKIMMINMFMNCL